MTKRPTPPLPSRRQLLLAALLLLVGVFAALKTAFDYVATSTLSVPYLIVAALGMVLGGRVLRRVKDNR